MARTAIALTTLALVLQACGKKDPGQVTPEPAPPTPRIDFVSATELPAEEGSVNAWDVTTPAMKGYLTFRLVDRDGSVQKYSSKIRVPASAKRRVTLRLRVVGRVAKVRWSMKGKDQETKGDCEVAIAEGEHPSPTLSVDGVPVSAEGHPLVIGKWHALMLHVWSPKGSEASARVPIGAEWFTLRLDGREVDLETYGLPVLQAHVRFTQE